MGDRRAVVSVIGKDQIGIIAEVTRVLAESRVNVLDISQTILQDFFTMMMIVDLQQAEVGLDMVRDRLDGLGVSLGLKINIQLEDVFVAMHRV